MLCLTGNNLVRVPRTKAEITNTDLNKLKKHTDGGNLAILRVGINSFYAEGSENIGENFEASLSGGNHYVVLTGIVSYDTKKNTITFNFYDDHKGLQMSKTMPLSRFKKMIFHVLMVEPKKKNE